jgi:hypothetical protein
MPKLKKVFPGGIRIILEDRSNWVIHPDDVHDVYTWIPGAEIEVTETNGDCEYNYKLENAYIDIAVRARKTI